MIVSELPPRAIVLLKVVTPRFTSNVCDAASVVGMFQITPPQHAVRPPLSVMALPFSA